MIIFFYHVCLKWYLVRPQAKVHPAWNSKGEKCVHSLSQTWQCLSIQNAEKCYRHSLWWRDLHSDANPNQWFSQFLCHCSRWVKIRVYSNWIYNLIISCHKSSQSIPAIAFIVTFTIFPVWYLRLWTKWFCLIYMSGFLFDGNVKLFCNHQYNIFSTYTRILQHFRFYYRLFEWIVHVFLAV